jgi:Mn-dependent DtxR family transcriptional regulator
MSSGIVDFFTIYDSLAFLREFRYNQGKAWKEEKTMTLLESGEMYLETILVLSGKKNTVRSIDVAEEMSFSKPSVSRAMGILKNGGYIEVDPKGAITLTDSGREVAERIYERHRILAAILMRLGVDEKTATDDACKMEHYISETSFAAIKAHLREHPSEGNGTV